MFEIAHVGYNHAVFYIRVAYAWIMLGHLLLLC